MTRRHRSLRSRALPLAAGALASLPLAAGAQGVHALASQAAAAMGGQQALRDLAATALDFQTVAFQLGQEETPRSPARGTISYGRITTDWRGLRRMVSQEVRPVAGPVVRQVRVTSGGIGMLTTDGRAAPDNAGAVAAAERAMRLEPHRIVLAVLDDTTRARQLPTRAWRRELTDGFRYAWGPDTLAIYFDRVTRLPVVTEVVTDDPILGDRRTETWYTRWQDAGGVMIARQIDVMVNDRLQSHSTISAAVINAGVTDSIGTVPDSIAALAQRPAPTPPPITVNLVELAPGVWRAEGGSHHSLVVEQPTQLVVVEAPQNRVRSRAVLDTLRSRFPQKRVGLVVNTHHHWDHAGGLREYMAAGVPVATHRRNVEFVREIARAPKRVAPDALSRTPRVPAVRSVEDSLSIGSGEGSVMLLRLPSVHAEGILAAYVPAHRLLFVADVLSPAPTLAPAGSREVAAMVRERGLAVDRVAGAHGGVAAWAEVEAAAR